MLDFDELAPGGRLAEGVCVMDDGSFACYVLADQDVSLRFGVGESGASSVQRVRSPSADVELELTLPGSSR